MIQLLRALCVLGPNYPGQAIYASVAQLEDTFFLLGGVDGSFGQDTVLKYNQEEESWEDAGVQVCLT